ncbi:MAG TPA: outer membrane beta-barrel protein [bacterium]|nr:outer membrane beta-barrel protein [bacterium]
MKTTSGRISLSIAVIAASLFATLAPSRARAEEGEGDLTGLVVGIDGGYSRPTGHDYQGQLDDALDTLHGFIGYRMFGVFSLEAAATDIQAPVKNSKATADIRSYSLDARLFVPIRSVQPNILFGYAPTASLHTATSTVSESLHGDGFILGAGLRMVVMPKLFLTADFRHQFIRYQKGDVTVGGITASGTFGSELRGDVWSGLVGGGVQF